MRRAELPSGHVLLGYVSSAVGLKGHLKVVSLCDPKDALFSYPSLECRWPDVPESRPFELEAQRSQKEHLIVKFRSVADRTAAESWRGAIFSIPRAAMPEPESGHYYWQDLIGLRASTVQGVSLGSVVSLMRTAAHDVLVMEGSGKRHLVPFILETFVRKVDLQSGLIVLDWDPSF